MSIQKYFIEFNNAIKVSVQDSVYSDARTKDDDISTEIKQVFRELGYPVIDTFLQGSFSTSTAILKKDGDFDIDRAIVIDSESAPDDPVKPKKEVLKVLERRGFKNAKVKKPCVTADYKGKNLHIDFPIYKFDGSTYLLAVGKENSSEANKEWSNSDPKGLKAWIQDKSEYGNSKDAKQLQFYRLVRYIKRWRDYKFSSDVGRKIFSIGLTVMVKKCFTPSFDEEGKAQDLIALRDTINKILSESFFSYEGEKQYQICVALPVSPYRDIFHGSSKNTATQLKNQLTNMQTKLTETVLESSEVKKCEKLRGLFGDDFPIPEDTSSSNSNGVKTAVFSTSGIVGTSQGA